MTDHARHVAAVEAAPLRRVRFWEPELAVERRPDGTILIRQVGALGPYPDRLTDRLVHFATTTPDTIFLADRDGDTWRTVTYREALDRVRHLAEGLLRLRPLARTPADHPFRQRYRARAPGARGAILRRSLRVRFAGLFAGLLRPRATARHLPPSDAGPCIRGRRRKIRRRDQRRRLNRHSGRHDTRRSAEARDDFLRDACRNGADRSRGCGPRQGWPRHDRQVSLHVGLNRLAQGRDQHAAHADREPGNGARLLRLHARRAADRPRLGAVEPHGRRQQGLQHGALQRRHPLHRRRAADAGGDRQDGAQPAGRSADLVFQRAEGLRGTDPLPRGRRDAAPADSSAAST